MGLDLWDAVRGSVVYSAKDIIKLKVIGVVFLLLITPVLVRFVRGVISWFRKPG